MAAPSNHQSLLLARQHEPSRLLTRAILRTIVTLILLVGATREFAQGKEPDQHLFLVDISGSMKITVKGLKKSKLQVRKDRLLEWLDQNKSGSVTLKSFDTAVYLGEDKVDLANPTDKNRALAWVNQLAIGKERHTHVWHCLGEALDTATKAARAHSTGSVTLHMLTDGRDTEKKTTKAATLGLFRNAKEQLPLPKWPRKGDFDVKVSSAGAPSPTPIGVSPTPTATPTATRSPIATSPSPTPTATASPTPTATRTPIISTPSPTPPPPSEPPRPTVTPPNRIPSPSQKVAFEIQEPQIVNSGQFVHFINKTLPPAPADSYVWTVRLNPTDGKKTDSDKKVSAPDDIKLSGEHPVHQFTNPKRYPLSYSVFLRVTNGGETMTAGPVAIIVQPPPTFLDKCLAVIKLLTLPGLGTVLTVIGGLLTRRRSQELKREGHSPAEIRQSKIWTWLLFGLAAVFMSVLVISGWQLISALLAEKSSLYSEQIPVPPVAPPLPKDNQPSGGTSDSPGTIEPDTHALSVIGIILLGVALTVAMAAVARSMSRRRGVSILNMFDRVSPSRSEIRGRSLLEQLDQFERFSKANIIPKNRLRVFKAPLFEQLRKLYKIPSKASRPKSLPELPEELTNLIGKLITQTEQGHLQWKVQYDNEGVMDPSRFSADVHPQVPKNETPAPTPPTESAPADAKNIPYSRTKVPPSRIEIYQTDTGHGMAIYNADGMIIKVIDRETFSIPADAEAQLGKLHEVTKDSVFEVKETLKDILNKLGVDPKSSPSVPPNNPPSTEAGPQKPPDN